LKGEELKGSNTVPSSLMFEPQQKTCQDCIYNKNGKVILICKHSICERCIDQYISVKFLTEKSYKDRGYCSICKKLQGISKIFKKNNFKSIFS